MNDVDVLNIKTALQDCCKENECSICTEKACLIGFSNSVLDYANIKKSFTMPNGINLVPNMDFKIYDVDHVATALAVITAKCKNCMDNHDDNCIVNIIRAALEVAIFGQHVAFKGNPLEYVM